MSASNLCGPSPVAEVPSDAQSSAGDLRTCVTISRTDERDARQRQVLARVDDAPVATLMWGDRHTEDVTPGRHVLRANNTLIWKSVTFTIEAGEHLEFSLINRSGRLTLGFLALLGVAPLYLTVERKSGVDER